MSAKPTYVLVCNGESCSERIVFEQSTPRKLAEARDMAGIEGWTRGRLRGRHGPAPIHDWCPACTKRREDPWGRIARMVDNE